MYFGLQPPLVIWAIALLFGLFGALLAIFFQTMAIGLGGFAAGTAIAAYIAGMIGFTVIPFISFIGGIAGVILLYAAFDWALIGLSSLVGAIFVGKSLNITPSAEMVLYTASIVAGIVFQASLLHNPHLETK